MAEYYSVALIGSSGGGTATLGHTDPIELLETVNKELLNIHDKNDTRICMGISHAVFVCLTDGSGFDAVRSEKDWVPGNNIHGDNLGPPAALYTVGFDNITSNNNDASTSTSMNQFTTSNDITSNKYVSMSNQFKVTLVDTGPLVKINRLAIKLDLILAETIKTEDCTIKAMVSISSEPTKIHTASLKACSRIINFPIVGSGGTSLSQIASLYDLRIVGNSGGSVASSTLTKAKGWATGLSEEWNMRYDEKDVSEANEQKNEDKKNTSQSPTLKSILESALPCFLFVCISLHLINAWNNRYGMDSSTSCIWDEENDNIIELNSSLSTIKYALQHIVLGTVCCVLVATTTVGSSVDQSTLLMSATVAGVLSSVSSSQSIRSSNISGGSALVGLVAGVFITRVIKIVSNLCHKYHITATMTNILCGGGVGMLVGSMINISGIAHALALITGMIRCVIRWRKLMPVGASDSLYISSLPAIPLLLPYCLVNNWLLPMVLYIQEGWIRLASHPSLSILFHEQLVQKATCTQHLLPVPIGLGFLYGCIFVYGSKIGWYHSLFLPLILIEMDGATRGEEGSLLGAIDECTLVMVCAGICSGNLILPHKSNDKMEGNRGSGQASLSWQALKTNIFCGDFIEAAYPSMERSSIINVFAYIAAGLSTEVLMKRSVFSTAYLPLPIAIWISNDRIGMGLACMIAYVVSFCGTIIANVISRL